MRKFRRARAEIGFCRCGSYIPLIAGTFTCNCGRSVEVRKKNGGHEYSTGCKAASITHEAK